MAFERDLVDEKGGRFFEKKKEVRLMAILFRSAVLAVGV